MNVSAPQRLAPYTNTDLVLVAIFTSLCRAARVDREGAHQLAPRSQAERGDHRSVNGR